MHILPLLDFISSVDNAVVTWLNSFVHRSWTVDYLACVASSATMLKGVALMAAFWWAWFRESETKAEPGRRTSRDTLLYTLLMCVPAVLIARLLAISLPFRARPIHNPALHLKLAFTLAPNTFESWSAFPSDHAVLFFTLATGFFLVSRQLGWLIYLYVGVVISFPRVYLGIHYPSDILAGALLGIAIASTVRVVALRRAINWPLKRLLDYSPGLFYACLFLISYQTAVLYQPTRHAIRVALRFVHVFDSNP